MGATSVISISTNRRASIKRGLPNDIHHEIANAFDVVSFEISLSLMFRGLFLDRQAVCKDLEFSVF